MRAKQTCRACSRPRIVRGLCKRCYDRDRYGYYDRRDDVLRVVVRPVRPLRAGQERGAIILMTEGGVTTAWERIEAEQPVMRTGVRPHGARTGEKTEIGV